MNTPVSPKCPARRARRGGWAIVLGENSGRGVQLILSDVRVAGHRGQVCVPEILGDQARVACGLAQPRRRRVAQCVRGDVLVDAGACRGAVDDSTATG